nr:ATP-binding protein [uncultured Desulfobulbus sp.]
MQWFFMTMVAAGAVILTISVHTSRGLTQLVPETLKPKWRILTLLIACFILGYCGYLIIQLAEITFPMQLLISVIFFGGSLFVYGIVSLTGHTLHSLKELNHNLEREVQKQTQKLHLSNRHLSQSEEKLREQNIFLNSVINALPHPFLVLDPQDHSILLANTAAGYSAQSGTTTCHQLSHGDNTPCTGKDHPCPLREIIKNQKQIVVEHVHHTPEGNEQIVEVHGYPVLNAKGNLTHVIEYSIDITLKKEIEAQLLQAKRTAEEANAAKGAFLANMSHEIRTPMNAILGMSYLALQTDLSPGQRNFIKKVHHSASHLLRILNDILDISKLEAGRMQIVPEPFILRECIDAVLETFQVQAEEKGLSLQTVIEPDLPKSFMGDDFRIRQVLVNLVGNAIKFTTSGSVTINVYRGLTSPGEKTSSLTSVPLHFQICDSGIGIAPEHVERIFDSFEQGDISFTRKFGGTGLGLSICSQIITLMGGKIWAESTLGTGSCFHFTLPLEQIEIQKDTEPHDTVKKLEKQIAGLRILLVDDNEVNREVTSMMLEANHSITSATNGLEALHQLASQEFDLIVMDVQMPVMDGITATTVIRTIEKGLPVDTPLPFELQQKLITRMHQRRVPIIAMTAHALEKDRNQCIQAGMDGFITKPFQYEQMLRSFEEIRQNCLRFA